MQANLKTQILLTEMGARIALLRYESGMRQEDLAAAVGRARSSIANIEAGRQDTTITVLAAIAHTLGTTVS